MLTIWNSCYFFFFVSGTQIQPNPKTLHKLVDPLLRVDKHERAQIMECVRVAQLCVDHRAKHRPVMSEVVTMLGMAASKG